MVQGARSGLGNGVITTQGSCNGRQGPWLPSQYHPWWEMAAGAQPLHWAAVRQVRYLASLGPAAGMTEATVEALTRQAETVDGPGLRPDTPDVELPFGLPAPYWLDLRGYDAPATAAALDLPVFLAQGGRDYQVTVADDLARWQAALADRPHVTVRVYDADNHLFFPGTGPSSPAEYEPAQHVDPAVIADIADWLATAWQNQFLKTQSD